MYMRIINLKRRPGESAEDHMIRYNRFINTRMAKIGATPWSQIVHKLHFTFIGHISRMESYDPERWALKLLKWRDGAYLQVLESQFGPGRQGHCRRLRTWRYERPILKFFRMWWQRLTKDERRTYKTWHCIASDKQFWYNLLPKYLAWREHNASF